MSPPMSSIKSPIIYIIIAITILSFILFGYNVFFPDDKHLIEMPLIPSESSATNK
jgi:hypothetical protein